MNTQNLSQEEILHRTVMKLLAAGYSIQSEGHQMYRVWYNSHRMYLKPFHFDSTGNNLTDWALVNTNNYRYCQIKSEHVMASSFLENTSVLFDLEQKAVKQRREDMLNAGQPII